MLNIATDLDADAVYLRVSDAPVEKTREITSCVLVDVAADGSPVGIELLGADSRWPVSDTLRMFAFDADTARMIWDVYGNRNVVS